MSNPEYLTCSYVDIANIDDTPIHVDPQRVEIVHHEKNKVESKIPDKDWAYSDLVWPRNEKENRKSTLEEMFNTMKTEIGLGIGVAVLIAVIVCCLSKRDLIRLIFQKKTLNRDMIRQAAELERLNI